MHPSLSSFFLKQKEPLKSCVLTLREIVLQYNTNITESVKYGMPCYLLSNKLFCYIWKDKKSEHPYLLIVNGHLIDHPNLIQGNRKKMKILPIDPNMDINIDSIQEVLRLASRIS